MDVCFQDLICMMIQILNLMVPGHLVSGGVSLINKKGRLEATLIINVTISPMPSDSVAVDNLANYLQVLFVFFGDLPVRILWIVRSYKKAIAGKL